MALNMSDLLGLAACRFGIGPVAAPTMAQQNSCQGSMAPGCRESFPVSEVIAPLSVLESFEVGPYYTAQPVGQDDLGSGANVQVVDLKVGGVTIFPQATYFGTANPGFRYPATACSAARTEAGINPFPRGAPLTNNNTKLEIIGRNIAGAGNETLLALFWFEIPQPV